MASELPPSALLRDFGIWLQRWAEYALQQAEQLEKDIDPNPTGSSEVERSPTEAVSQTGESPSEPPQHWLQAARTPGPPAHWLALFEEEGEKPPDADGDPAGDGFPNASSPLQEWISTVQNEAQIFLGEGSSDLSKQSGMQEKPAEPEPEALASDPDRQPSRHRKPGRREIEAAEDQAGEITRRSGTNAQLSYEFQAAPQPDPIAPKESPEPPESTESDHIQRHDDSARPINATSSRGQEVPEARAGAAGAEMLDADSTAPPHAREGEKPPITRLRLRPYASHTPPDREEEVLQSVDQQDGPSSAVNPPNLSKYAFTPPADAEVEAKIPVANEPGELPPSRRTIHPDARPQMERDRPETADGIQVSPPGTSRAASDEHPAQRRTVHPVDVDRTAQPRPKRITHIRLAPTQSPGIQQASTAQPTALSNEASPLELPGRQPGQISAIEGAHQTAPVQETEAQGAGDPEAELPHLPAYPPRWEQPPPTEKQYPPRPESEPVPARWPSPAKDLWPELPPRASFDSQQNRESSDASRRRRLDREQMGKPWNA